MDITIKSDYRPGRVYNTLKVVNGSTLAVAVYEIGNPADQNRALGKCMAAILVALNGAACLPPSNAQ